MSTLIKESPYFLGTVELHPVVLEFPSAEEDRLYQESMTPEKMEEEWGWYLDLYKEKGMT